MESITASSWKERLQKRWDAFYLQWQIYSMTYFLEPWEKCLFTFRYSTQRCGRWLTAVCLVIVAIMFRKVWKSISSVYLLYELNTCIYMLDPWEKRFVNAFIFAILGLLIFSSYTFLPGYTRKLVSAFLPAQSTLSDLDLDHQRSMEFNIH